MILLLRQRHLAVAQKQLKLSDAPWQIRSDHISDQIRTKTREISNLRLQQSLPIHSACKKVENKQTDRYTLPAKRLRTNKEAHTLCLQNLLDTAHRPRHKLQSKFTVHTLCMDSNCTHALNFSHTGNHDPNANSDHASPHAQHYICCKNFHLLTCLWQLTLCLFLFCFLVFTFQ